MNESTVREGQELKADKGKARLGLVPMRILWAIARVREFGVAKYGQTDGWRRVSPERYRDAMMRHIAAYIDNPTETDAESGLPHLWHAACNIAFLIALECNGKD